MLTFSVVLLAVAVAVTSAAVFNRLPDSDELAASASDYGYGHSEDYGGPGYITKYPVGDIYGLGHHEYSHGYGHHSYHHHGPPVVYIPGKFCKSLCLFFDSRSICHMKCEMLF